MAMNQMTAAAKVAKLREMAKDKSLPQDVRNTYLDEAVKLEEKGAMKAGVKLAKGGAVAKPAVKKMMYGGAVAKELPMRGSRTATNMAKGGAAMKAKKK